MTTDQEQRLKAAMSEAVVNGIRTALADKATMSEFWGTAFESLQHRAQQQTGRMLLGGVISVAKKVLTVGALLWLAYSIGGGTLAAKVWHVLTS